jgi:hypothetical protein
MKTGTVLVAILFAVTSFPLLAQQAPPGSPPNSPATQPGGAPMTQPDNSAPVAQPPSPAQAQPANPPGTQQASPASGPEASAVQATPAVVPATPAVAMRPVNAELVSKLDSKTAKTGDEVVVQTKSSVKTADGTEIPKGSKLLGHIVAVQASAGGQNSQMALQFDHAELKGGQSVAIHSEIQSIAPAGGESPSSASAAAPPAGGSASPNSPNGGMGGGGGTGAAAAPGYTPGYTPSASGASAAGNGEPAAGTVVARNGKIAIRTTSVPGVLLANNAPGEQDPRMAQASGILLGAKKDVQLDGGTQMVLGVAAAAK